MKTLIAAAVLAFGLVGHAHAAKSVFETLAESAPRSPFDQIQDTAPRAPFDQINATAPRSVFETLNESAPRSDGVFGQLENSAP
jgi:ABC-type oligopeptide transport system substrate-binding subunit